MSFDEYVGFMQSFDVTLRRAKRYTASYTKAYATQMHKELGVRVIVFSMQKGEEDEVKVHLYVTCFSPSQDAYAILAMTTTAILLAHPLSRSSGRHGRKIMSWTS